MSRPKTFLGKLCGRDTSRPYTGSCEKLLMNDLGLCVIKVCQNENVLSTVKGLSPRSSKNTRLAIRMKGHKYDNRR